MMKLLTTNWTKKCRYWTCRENDFQVGTTSGSLFHASAKLSTTHPWYPCWATPAIWKERSWKEHHPNKSRWWLSHPFAKICASQIGSYPQVGVKQTNIWNHHLELLTAESLNGASPCSSALRYLMGFLQLDRGECENSIFHIHDDTYCWWLRNPAITSWFGTYPIIYMVLYIPTAP